MVNVIRYKVSKLIDKIYLLAKIEFYDEKIDRLKQSKKISYYLKKIILNPKLIFLYLTGKKFSVKKIEMVLTTVCTLNCKGCSALMNEYKESHHLDINQNIKALGTFLNSVDSLRQLRLLGGEPLCYPNLYEMLIFVNNQEKIKRVSIVTNGTLLIQDRKILEILQNKKFDIYISNYGKNSRRKEELINQLKENNIKYILIDEDKLWRDYGNLECRKRKEKELKKQFSKCKVMCNSIIEGKIHHCPRSSHGTYLKKIGLRKKDYVDLLDKNIDQKQLRKQLYKFFYGYVPYIEACNYCNSGTNILKNIPAGEQYEKSKCNNPNA